jgi:hypothetical protein
MANLGTNLKPGGQLFPGPAANFPSSGGQMDHCVGEVAVSGPRS